MRIGRPLAIQEQLYAACVHASTGTLPDSGRLLQPHAHHAETAGRIAGIRASGTVRQCWNRPLNTLLLTWHDFRIGERHDLAAPIGCTLSVHHSYSRTIIHRVYDSVEAYCVQSLLPPEQFTLLKI